MVAPLSAARVNDALRGGLIVSCQAPAGSPMADPYVTACVGEAAVLGGAVGLRINGPEDIAAVRAVTDVPILGLYKTCGANRLVITPDFERARQLVEAGADVVALDATREAKDEDLSLIQRVREELLVPVMADISTYEEGMRAAESGADLVGTTLSGYTPETMPCPTSPDIELVVRLADQGVKVVAEGRYRCVEEVSEAFDAGAFAVVVGGAITDPLKTSALFAAVTPAGQV